MDCADVRERLSALLDNELEPAEHEAVTAHIGGCRECRREFDKLRRMDNLYRALPRAETPDDFEQRVRGSLQDGSSAVRLRFRQDRRQSFRLWPALAAAAVLLIVTGVTMVLFKGATERYQLAEAPKGTPLAEQEGRTATLDVQPPGTRDRTGTEAPSTDALDEPGYSVEHKVVDEQYTGDAEQGSGGGAGAFKSQDLDSRFRGNDETGRGGDETGRLDEVEGLRSYENKRKKARRSHRGEASSFDAGIQEPVAAERDAKRGYPLRIEDDHAPARPEQPGQASRKTAEAEQPLDASQPAAPPPPPVIAGAKHKAEQSIEAPAPRELEAAAGKTIAPRLKRRVPARGDKTDGADANNAARMPTVAGRTFIRDNGAWFQQGYNGEPTIPLERDLAAWGNLLEEWPQLSEIQEFDGPVFFQVDGKWYKLLVHETNRGGATK